jgi:nitroimidazol reductase NimA-like FMN-containing flavoprotein (pyridoxamine 5'-phosphate oxidase superfamily)
LLCAILSSKLEYGTRPGRRPSGAFFDYEEFNLSTFHPRRIEREITDLNEIKRIIKNGKYTSISFSKDNEPYIVTLSYGFDEENDCLYFHCALDGEKMRYIEVNNHVCATIIEDHGYQVEKCTHSYSSLILRGNMYVVNGIDEKKHGIDVLLSHLEKEPYISKKKNTLSDKSYEKVKILCFKIASISGKFN